MALRRSVSLILELYAQKIYVLDSRVLHWRRTNTKIGICEFLCKLSFLFLKNKNPQNQFCVLGKTKTGVMLVVPEVLEIILRCGNQGTRGKCEEVEWKNLSLRANQKVSSKNCGDNIILWQFFSFFFFNNIIFLYLKSLNELNSSPTSIIFNGYDVCTLLSKVQATLSKSQLHQLYCSSE